MPKGLIQAVESVAGLPLLNEDVLQLLDALLANSDIVFLPRVEALDKMSLGFRLKVEIDADQGSHQ